MSLAGPPETPEPVKNPSCMSVDGVLAGWNGTDDLWVFAYGSLIWRPCFPSAERRLVTVHGYHRSLCIWSHDHRGSPEMPGLVFGLKRGGCCRGVAYRIASEHVRDTFQALWTREMLTGAYRPSWVSCDSRGVSVRALVFLLNRDCREYAGSLPDDHLLAVVKRAVGVSGACLDYVLQTDLALRAHGIGDCRLGALVQRLSDAPNSGAWDATQIEALHDAAVALSPATPVPSA
jgi:cation transport protein ChaC